MRTKPVHPNLSCSAEPTEAPFESSVKSLTVTPVDLLSGYRANLSTLTTAVNSLLRPTVSGELFSGYRANLSTKTAANSMLMPTVSGELLSGYRANLSTLTTAVNSMLMPTVSGELSGYRANLSTLTTTVNSMLTPTASGELLSGYLSSAMTAKGCVNLGGNLSAHGFRTSVSYADLFCVPALSVRLRRFEILFPLQFNNGEDVPPKLLIQARHEIRGRFNAVSWNGGIQGEWPSDGRFHDNSMLIWVDVADLETNCEWIKSYSERWKKRLGQEELYARSYIVDVV